MMTATHEATAWMRDRLAHIERLAQPQHQANTDTTLVVPLGLTRTRAGTREDRSCDRCGTYVPTGQDLFAVIRQPLHWLIVIGGLCTACQHKENTP